MISTQSIIIWKTLESQESSCSIYKLQGFCAENADPKTIKYFGKTNDAWLKLISEDHFHGFAITICPNRGCADQILMATW